MFKFIYTIIISLSCIVGCKTVSNLTKLEKNEHTMGAVMNLQIKNIDYSIFIKSIIEQFSQNNFKENDPLLGKLSIFSHKTNNYKNDLGSCRQTMYNNIQINLTKNRNSQVWQYLNLSNAVGSINDSLPELHEDFFSKDSDLVKIEVKQDSSFDAYNYIYVYKNKIRVIFVVRQQDFNNESYPRNYITIKMAYI